MLKSAWGQDARCHFAGTQNRNPLNYAKVAVVLDNSDHFIKLPRKKSVSKGIFTEMEIVTI